MTFNIPRILITIVTLIVCARLPRERAQFTIECYSRGTERCQGLSFSSCQRLHCRKPHDVLKLARSNENECLSKNGSISSWPGIPTTYSVCIKVENIIHLRYVIGNVRLRASYTLDLL